MSNAETLLCIKAIVAKIKHDPTLSERLSDQADLIDEVRLDSLEMLQFMLDLEASLRVQIDFERLEYETLRSIERLAAVLDAMPARVSSEMAG